MLNDFVRLLPLSMTRVASEWYLNLIDAERAYWDDPNLLFLKQFGSE